MQKDTGQPIPALKVDGGAAANNLLMQHQADVLGIPVRRGKVLETTALGAAYLAGLATGFWPNTDAIATSWREDRVFTPEWTIGERGAAIQGWQDAVRRARG